MKFVIDFTLHRATHKAILLAFVLALSPYRLADIRKLILWLGQDAAPWTSPFKHGAVLMTSGTAPDALSPEAFRAVELVARTGLTRFCLKGVLRQDSLMLQRIAEGAYPALLSQAAQKQIQIIDGEVSLADCD